MSAPGPAAGIVVATHFVYSTALKRKRTFRALGWDAPPAANRSSFAPGECWGRARKGILFGHTYLTYSSSSKSVLCALPTAERPECACCEPMPSLESLEKRAAIHTENTAGVYRSALASPNLARNAASEYIALV